MWQSPWSAPPGAGTSTMQQQLLVNQHGLRTRAILQPHLHGLQDGHHRLVGLWNGFPSTCGSILFLPCPCYYSPLPPHHSTYLQSSSCDFLAYRSSTSALPLPPGSVLFRPPTAHPPTNFSIRAQVTTLRNKLMSSRSRRRRFENTPFSRFFSNLNIG